MFDAYLEIFVTNYGYPSYLTNQKTTCVTKSGGVDGSSQGAKYQQTDPEDEH